MKRDRIWELKDELNDFYDRKVITKQEWKKYHDEVLYVYEEIVVKYAYGSYKTSKILPAEIVNQRIQETEAFLKIAWKRYADEIDAKLTDEQKEARAARMAQRAIDKANRKKMER